MTAEPRYCIMKQRPDVVMVMARLSSWFLVLVLVQVTDLSVLAHVTFPSDSSLKISLPEWQPADRASRAAEWKRSRPQYGQSRRGEAVVRVVRVGVSWG